MDMVGNKSLSNRLKFFGLVMRMTRHEDDFEKQMFLAKESDKTPVRVSPSQVQVDQLEGWIEEKPIPMW